jgi:thiamine biosynthesis lipoprotein
LIADLHRFEFAAMGSPCELLLGGAARRDAEDCARLVHAEVARLEQRYSRYRGDSVLAAINDVAARGGSLEVDEETASLLDYAAACHEQSEGRFDVTTGVLAEVWGRARSTLPSADEVAAIKARVGWALVDWQAPRLGFGRPGMALDFGGIVKEFAVDRAAMLCREAGWENALVNLGGDLRALGSRPDRRAWQIDIRDPLETGRTLGRLQLRGQALATSGDYARCIEIDGCRYGHILSPRSGWPTRHLVSVSVVADLCVVAGSVATIGILMEERGADWLGESGLPHLWVDVNGRIGGSLAAGLASG